jgi:hypothetical protein
MDYWRAPQHKLPSLRKARPELFVQIAQAQPDPDRELVV